MTKEVKRYQHAPSQYARMFIDTLPAGFYVQATDYAALEQECERVKADRSACWAEFKVMMRACLDAEKERDAALLQVEALRELLADWAAHFTGPKVIGGPLSTLRERTDAALKAKP